MRNGSYVKNGVRVFKSPITSWNDYFNASGEQSAVEGSVEDEDEEWTSDPAQGEYNLGPLDAEEEEVELPSEITVRCSRRDYAIASANRQYEHTGRFIDDATVTDLGDGTYKLTDIMWNGGGEEAEEIVNEILGAPIDEISADEMDNYIDAVDNSGEAGDGGPFLL